MQTARTPCLDSPCIANLELDVQAGIPRNKVPQNATLNAARIMMLHGDGGSIAAGKLADVTLVNGDPVANLSDIRKTSLVMKDGVLYSHTLTFDLL